MQLFYRLNKKIFDIKKKHTKNFFKSIFSEPYNTRSNKLTRHELNVIILTFPSTSVWHSMQAFCKAGRVELVALAVITLSSCSPVFFPTNMVNYISMLKIFLNSRQKNNNNTSFFCEIIM